MKDKVLEVPQFIPLIYKSIKQYVFSVAYDVPKVWNKVLNDFFLCHIFSVLGEQNKSLSLLKSIPTLALSHFWTVSMVWTPLLRLWTQIFFHFLYPGCCTLQFLNSKEIKELHVDI